MKKSSVIENLSAGKEDALKSVFQLYNRRLLHFSKQFVQDQEVAEEIVSDIFVKVWGLREGFDSMEKLQAFMYISVKNASINHLRTAHVRQTIESIDASMDLHCQDSDTLMKIIRTELIDSIYSEMSKLPEKQREVFILTFVEDLDAEEIGKKLGMSTAAVYANKSRAIATLRQSLPRTDTVYLWVLLSLFS